MKIGIYKKFTFFVQFATLRIGKDWSIIYPLALDAKECQVYHLRAAPV